MKGIRYILSLLVLIVTTISCERDDDHRYPMQGTGRLIEFAVENEWPEISKAAINSVEDINIFKVWGRWNENPDSQYYTNETSTVFGSDGSNVTYQNNEWKCAYEAEWYEGYYNFAAFYPNMPGNHISEFTRVSSAESTTIEYVNELQFYFNNFTGATQFDCMYAFSNVDNSANTASTVDLHFEHLFSLLTINIAANTTTAIPRNLDVTIYGIHRSITGSVAITHTEVITDYGTPNEQRVVNTTNNLKDILSSQVVSTETLYYKKSSFTNDEHGSTDIITPVFQWIVFPENLEDTPLTIKVDFKNEEGQITKTMKTIVNTGEWESGKSYAYTLLTD